MTVPAPAPLPRLPFLSEEPENPEVREIFDRLRRRWQGAPVLNLYRLLGWAPGLVGPWQEFGHALRFRTSAPAGLRELMVVRSGRLLEADYEWKHHWVAALDEGVSEDKLHALDGWQKSTLFSAEERAVLALADDTALGTGASVATMDELKALFPTEQVAELVIVAGFYAGVSRVINSFGVPIESGFESMLPRED